MPIEIFREMGRIQRNVVVLVLTLHAVAASAVLHLGEDADIRRPTFDIDDELELMEPRIVAEPKDGSTWWYTPSRKAHIFKHRFNKAIRQLEQQHNQKGINKQGEEMRLPGDIIPISYNVRMLPYVELIESGNYTTDGYVEIVFQCLRSTVNISINSAGLVIHKGTISVCKYSSMMRAGFHLFFNRLGLGPANKQPNGVGWLF